MFAVSLLLGENFVGRQAWDIGRVFEALGAPGGFPGKPVGLYARGENACLAATYAVARASDAGGSQLRWYLLRDGFLSFRAFLDRPRSMPASYRLLPEDRDRTTAFDREIPASYFAFDALRSFDLPQLLAASRAKGLIVNPWDGDWERLPEIAAQSLLPPSDRVVSAEEPGPRVGEFLQEVLGRVDEAAGERAESSRTQRSSWLRRIDGRALPQGGEREEEPVGMLARDVRSRVQAANLKESQEWDGVKTRDDWERFRQPRMRGLRESLGLPSANPDAPRVLVTRTLEGDGYRIENLVFESRPGLVRDRQPLSPGQSAEVDARHPDLPQPSQPQDAGRAAGHGHDLGPQRLPGPGHGPLGHGERRQHPFRTEADYPQPVPGRPAGLLLPLQHRRCSCTLSARA